MAWGRRGFSRGRQGTTTRTSSWGGNKPGYERKEWVPRIDKNPFYRTHDILNGIFRRKGKDAIKLEFGGEASATDLKTIWVSISKVPSEVDEDLGADEEGRPVYLLTCGHKFTGRKDSNHPKGHEIDCDICGGSEAYLSFEHEWSHIWARSTISAYKAFAEQYAASLKPQAPSIPTDALAGFIMMFMNALDDMRVNGLNGYVWPGSAMKIWRRWKRLSTERGDEINQNFLDYTFAVALGVPTDPNGEYEPLRPMVEWAVSQVKKGMGPGKMMALARVTLDRCMGAILAKIPPPQPKMPGQQAGGTPNVVSQDGAQQGTKDPSNSEDQGGEDQEPGEGDGQHQQNAEGSREGDADTSQGDGDGAEQAPLPDGIPSASQMQASQGECEDALNKLMQGNPRALDPKENHPVPDQDPTPQVTAAMLGKALQLDVTDTDAIQSAFQDAQNDADVQAALQQLQNTFAQKSKDSQLTSDAKARLLFIDVMPEGMDVSSQVILDDTERMTVNRLRAAFYKTLGRQKAKRSPEGTRIDVQAAIQYQIEPDDADIFENEAVNQGFAYHVLCDMSGSMSYSYPSVTRAVEMLKQSLKFPFVVGNLWSFRGAEATQLRVPEPGEVWVYRYNKACRGYTGTTTIRIGHQRLTFPVHCGGLTPMNSAIHVSSKHLVTQMPSGMAKRMFVLTDGSPCHTKVSGGGIPEFLLRQFVAKEINWARQHGVQVYTLVIGDSISDDDCKKMFGASKFWRRVAERGSENEVGQVLSRLVLDNFTRYMKARG